MENPAAETRFINSEEIGSFTEVTVPTAPNDIEEDIRIHYYETGSGEPLLLIHGIGQSLYTWRYLYPELSENYRVIAIDLPGHGYSSRPEKFCYSMDEMAELIHAFLVSLGISSTHMIGFSTGAMYMMRFIAMYPEMSANCIAISPGGITNKMPRRIRNLRKGLKSVFARNLFTQRNVKNWLKECSVDPSCFDEDAVSQYYGPVSDGLSREALMYAVKNFDMKYATEEIRGNEHEVLMLWGKEDQWHRPNNSVFFQGVLSNARYFLIRSAGHIVQEEAPEKVLEIIENYIPVMSEEEKRECYKDFSGKKTEEPLFEAVPEEERTGHLDFEKAYSEAYEAALAAENEDDPVDEAFEEEDEALESFEETDKEPEENETALDDEEDLAQNTDEEEIVLFDKPEQ